MQNCIRNESTQRKEEDFRKTSSEIKGKHLTIQYVRIKVVAGLRGYGFFL